MVNSKSVVLAVVISLAVVAIAVVIGAIVLGVGGHTVDPALWALGGSAVGAIGGLLARTSTEPEPFHPAAVLESIAEPVHYVSQPANPPTTTTPPVTFSSSENVAPMATFLAVDGTLTRPPKQAAKVARARATRVPPSCGLIPPDVTG